MPRFVVLRHEMPGDARRTSHWDLMFERGDRLRTWALSAQPEAGTTACIDARPLPDHKMDYLDYEGPISRNRGHVRRVDQGTFTVLAETRDELVVRCVGQRLRGTAKLWRMLAADGGWMFAMTDE